MSKSLHSIIIPVFNEEAGLLELFRRLEVELEQPLKIFDESIEIIFIDDGSTDKSAEIILEHHFQHPHKIKLIEFSRNFGHQTAISAGLDFASGDTVIAMDADLQDPPHVVLQMIDKWREGYEVVFGVRNKREAESAFKLFSASLFYRLLSASTGIDIPIDTGDFRLMDRKAAMALGSMRENHRFIRGMAAWVGFRKFSVFYDREARFAGETKYPIRKMLKLAWDAFTGFSLIPLRIATYIGLLTSTCSVFLALWTIYVRYFTNSAVRGWSSLMIVMLFLGGVQLFAIGVLGEYVGRIFEQVKQRPLYIVRSKLGDFSNCIANR